MAKLICKKCAHVYGKKDKTCPNCMAEINDTHESNQLSTSEEISHIHSEKDSKTIPFSEFKKLNKSEKKEFFNGGGKVKYSRKDKITIAFGIIFFCLFAMVVLAVVNAPEKPKTPEEIATEAAEKAAKELTSGLESKCISNVSARLKLPETMDIDYGSLKTNMKNDLNGYAVYFKFVAENKYSMKVHNEALCTFNGNKKLDKVIIK
ncbi:MULTISPECIES: hypothetical protein [Enterobacteriaceae]|nr:MULTISPECIES: hypothetical protein [Enterobacteriaceae]MBN6242693.1 hypothetical protein [Escherichia coli]MBO9064411.1 hypothetical protein [Escherichia coli]MBW7620272.1 hypothetical protein [Citrobacter portucalensis]MBW7639094.1 hypothetical protein [Citrobacter portucalensis]MCA2134322.1 hypothetical protein [Citrobacter portucalensis]